MQQNALSKTGGTGSTDISRMLSTALDTLRLRIMQKNGLKAESTCLPLGGMINAHGPETTPVEFVDPEPGVGYGGSWKIKGQDAMKNRLGMTVHPATCHTGESGGIRCT
jgi:hypothetical protein